MKIVKKEQNDLKTVVFVLKELLKKKKKRITHTHNNINERLAF